MKNKAQKSTIESRNALKLAAAAGLAIGALTPSSVWAIARDWSVASGTWNVSGNWSPTGSPGGLDSALIGSAATAANGTVTLNVSPSIAGLTVTDGMTLDTNGQALLVGTTSNFSGQNNVGSSIFNSRLLVRTNAGSYSFKTLQNLNVTNFGKLEMIGGKLEVGSTLFLDSTSTLAGTGTVNFTGTGTSVFTLEGFVQPSIGTLTFNQLSAGKFDLDGNGVANRRIDVVGYNPFTQQGTVLTFNGTGLADEYDDSLRVGGRCSFNMNLTGGWTMGTGTLEFTENVFAPGAAQLNGSTLTCNSDIRVIGANAWGQINAPVTMPGLVTVTLDPGSRLQTTDVTRLLGASFVLGAGAKLDIDGTGTLSGGNYTLAQNANVNFNEPFYVGGGTFNTFSTNAVDGKVNFNNATTFNNTITVNGVGQMNGVGKVNQTAVINANVFDMDGASQLATWNIGGSLTVNASAIDTADNVFDGSINLLASPGNIGVGAMKVNLPAGQSWRMNGNLNISNDMFGTLVTPISGSPVILSGSTVVNGNNNIPARTTFDFGGLTTINAGSYFQLTGGTIADPNVMAGGIINGNGTLTAAAFHGLVGHGTIGANVDFHNSARLLAKDGTLFLTGSRFHNAGTIGTADSTGTLEFFGSFIVQPAMTLNLNGGRVLGYSIGSLGKIMGHGTISSQAIANNNEISAVGGELVIDTVDPADMDGVVGGVPAVYATQGDLRVTKAFADPMDGIVNVGAMRTARFDGGWQLSPIGTLNLIGGFLPAKVAGGLQELHGAINVTLEGAFDAKTIFPNEASVKLANGTDRLALLQDATVLTGATFTGLGTLRNASGSTLTPEKDSHIDVKVVNDGTLMVAKSNDKGVNYVKSLVQMPSGAINFGLASATPGTGHDQVRVTQGAALDGRVQLVRLGSYDPQYLVPHEIIKTGPQGASGFFKTVGGIQISPTKFWAVTYESATDSVVATAAIPGDANLDGTVNISDFAIIGANFNTAGPWAEADFNGDGLADIGDFSLLAANFNMSVPLPRGAAVPEPSLVACGLAFAAALNARRRCRRAK